MASKEMRGGVSIIQEMDSNLLQSNEIQSNGSAEEMHLMYDDNSGAAVLWLSVRTHNTGVVSSNPARVTIKTPLVRKATEIAS